MRLPRTAVGRLAAFGASDCCSTKSILSADDTTIANTTDNEPSITGTVL